MDYEGSKNAVNGQNKESVDSPLESFVCVRSAWNTEVTNGNFRICSDDAEWTNNRSPDGTLQKPRVYRLLKSTVSFWDNGRFSHCAEKGWVVGFYVPLDLMVDDRDALRFASQVVFQRERPEKFHHLVFVELETAITIYLWQTPRKRPQVYRVGWGKCDAMMHSYTSNDRPQLTRIFASDIHKTLSVLLRWCIGCRF